MCVVLYNALQRLSRRLLYLLLFISVFCGLMFGARVHAQQKEASVPSSKFALLIGNSHYNKNQLQNPQYDVQMIADKLSDLEFEVTVLQDLSQRQMIEGLLRFGKRAINAKLRVFYYSGHGMSENGDEYIIPVDFDFDMLQDEDTNREAYLNLTALSLNSVLTNFEKGTSSSNVLIFDACRTVANVGVRGIKRVESLQGKITGSREYNTQFFYSTLPKEPALDGIRGDGSLFAQALADNLVKQNLSYTELTRKVTNRVKELSKNKQVPWVAGSPLRDIMFWKENDDSEQEEGDDFPALLKLADSNTLRINACKKPKDELDRKVVSNALNLFYGTEGKTEDRREGWVQLAQAAEHCDVVALFEMGKIAEKHDSLDQARGLIELSIEYGIDARRVLKRINRRIRLKK